VNSVTLQQQQKKTHTHTQPRTHTTRTRTHAYTQTNTLTNTHSHTRTCATVSAWYRYGVDGKTLEVIATGPDGFECLRDTVSPSEIVYAVLRVVCIDVVQSRDRYDKPLFSIVFEEFDVCLMRVWCLCVWWLCVWWLCVWCVTVYCWLSFDVCLLMFVWWVCVWWLCTCLFVRCVWWMCVWCVIWHCLLCVWLNKYVTLFDACLMCVWWLCVWWLCVWWLCVWSVFEVCLMCMMCGWWHCVFDVCCTFDVCLMCVWFVFDVCLMCVCGAFAVWFMRLVWTSVSFRCDSFSCRFWLFFQIRIYFLECTWCSTYGKRKNCISKSRCSIVLAGVSCSDVFNWTR